MLWVWYSIIFFLPVQIEFGTYRHPNYICLNRILLFKLGSYLAVLVIMITSSFYAFFAWILAVILRNLNWQDVLAPGVAAVKLLASWYQK